MIYRLLATFFILLSVGCSAPNSVETFDAKTSAYFLSSDKLISINGLKVRYREEGLADAPTIVMIHGFTSSLESWDGLASELSGEFRIFRMDLPGHGLTGPDHKGRYSNEQTVEFLSGFLEVLDVERPVIVGNSLGGLTAWRYASSYPEDVSALVLIAPGGFSINGVTEKPLKVPPMVKYYLVNAPEAGVKQALSALYGNPEKIPESRFTNFRELMKTPGNGEAFVERAETFTLPEPGAKLETLKIPTLLLWGDEDIMVPAAHGEKFSSLLPDSYLVTYTGVGHIPQEEVPNRVANDIRDFLEKQKQ